jgi:hypothetical protein
MDMPDSTLVMVMTQGAGANLTNDEKRALFLPKIISARSMIQSGKDWYADDTPVR